MSRERIGAYIAKAQPLARPILDKIRERVRKAAPDAEDDIKWGAPALLTLQALPVR
ncbi:MAG: DUF1801 domain-containing protein [Sphingomonas sp.]|nr:DUF1801 domain-containing protein [Sphingomonas sp.]